jgi:hypothetical protein
MTWRIEREESALSVSIEVPMNAEWERLLDDIQASLRHRDSLARTRRRSGFEPLSAH